MVNLSVSLIENAHLNPPEIRKLKNTIGGTESTLDSERVQQFLKLEIDFTCQILDIAEAEVIHAGGTVEHFGHPLFQAFSAEMELASGMFDGFFQK